MMNGWKIVLPILLGLTSVNASSDAGSSSINSRTTTTGESYSSLCEQVKYNILLKSYKQVCCSLLTKQLCMLGLYVFAHRPLQNHVYTICTLFPSDQNLSLRVLLIFIFIYTLRYYCN